MKLPRTAPFLGRGRFAGERPDYFFRTAVSTFLVVMGIAIIAPVLPDLAASLDLSGFEVGLLLAAFAGGRFGFSLPGGALADRFGFRSVALAGCVCTACCAFLAAAAGTFGVLVVAQLGQGAGSALFNTAAMAWVVSRIGHNATGLLLSEYQATVLVGMSVAPAIGGVSAALVGVRGPFIVYGVCACIAAVVTACTPESDASQRAVDSAGRLSLHLAALLRDRAFFLAMIAALIYFWTLGGVRNTLIPLFASRQLDMSVFSIGLALTVIGVTHVASIRFGGRLIDTVGRRPVLRASMAALAACVGALGLSTSVWVLITLLAALGVIQGLIGVAPIAVLADVAEYSIRGVAVGVYRTVSALGLALGSLLVGGLADRLELRAVFPVCAVIVAAGALLVARIPETLRREAI